MAVAHTSKIEFIVELDENKIPENISWTAEDGGIEGESSKAIMLSVWDHKKKDTLRMDLWTKDMPGGSVSLSCHHFLPESVGIYF